MISKQGLKPSRVMTKTDTIGTFRAQPVGMALYRRRDFCSDNTIFSAIRRLNEQSEDTRYILEVKGANVYVTRKY